MAYNELVKNFEKIRAYMREFYIYGFKSRDGYDQKSPRSYDDEKRRMESWLGEYMHFVRTAEGKNVFISLDSRSLSHNPFFKALKAKSFTDGDITLHFIVFDILHDENAAYSLQELIEKIDKDYLSFFENPMVFDESTLRKKLKEYIEEGIIVSEKRGKRLVYKRAKDVIVDNADDAIDFCSEVAPCGGIGSFIADKGEKQTEVFSFKHHYITSAIDSDVLCSLLSAMQSKSIVTVRNLSRKSIEPRKNRVIPLKIYVSVQNGRQYLIAYQPDFNSIKSFRMDYLSDVKIEEPTPRFDELRKLLTETEKKMWGVTCRGNLGRKEVLEHVEFTVKVERGEEHIVKRLKREKRVGEITKIDDFTYRFSADVYDTSEILPWIRTFICRITKLNFSNRTIENKLKRDISEMYKMYGVGVKLMVFSELYSAYYNTVAKIVRAIIGGEADKNAVYKIIMENAFEESVLGIMPAIKDERWQIITKDLKTPIENPPEMPLTLLQKRWLKAILEDERIKLFDLKITGLDGVTPLFTKDDYRVYDKYADGDDFADEEYIKKFKTILYAAKNSLPVQAEMVNRKGNNIRLKFIPQKLEYSEKDDKFRVIVRGNRHVTTVNVARLTECLLYDGEFKIRPAKRQAERSTVTMIVNDERNALERTMLHFAHFEKRVEKIGGRKYKLIVNYDGDDETEMVIRVLSFGPLVEVVEPESFRELIKEKLKKQLSCGLK